MSGEGFEGIGDFDSSDPWERFRAHQAAKGRSVPAPLEQIEAQLEREKIDAPDETERS